MPPFVVPSTLWTRTVLDSALAASPVALRLTPALDSALAQFPTASPLPLLRALFSLFSRSRIADIAPTPATPAPSPILFIASSAANGTAFAALLTLVVTLVGLTALGLVALLVVHYNAFVVPRAPNAAVAQALLVGLAVTSLNHAADHMPALVIGLTAGALASSAGYLEQLYVGRSSEVSTSMLTVQQLNYVPLGLPTRLDEPLWILYIIAALRGVSIPGMPGTKTHALVPLSRAYILANLPRPPIAIRVLDGRGGERSEDSGERLEVASDRAISDNATGAHSPSSLAPRKATFQPPGPAARVAGMRKVQRFKQVAAKHVAASATVSRPSHPRTARAGLTFARQPASLSQTTETAVFERVRRTSRHGAPMLMPSSQAPVTDQKGERHARDAPHSTDTGGSMAAMYRDLALYDNLPEDDARAHALRTGPKKKKNCSRRRR